MFPVEQKTLKGSMHQTFESKKESSNHNNCRAGWHLLSTNDELEKLDQRSRVISHQFMVNREKVADLLGILQLEVSGDQSGT